MGSKYTTTSVTGYNSSPPADDGSAVGSNQVKWNTVKTKVGDPLNTFAGSIDTKLVTALDLSMSTTAVTYTTTAADHLKPVRVTAAATIHLGDAATMAVGYQTTVVNAYSASITVDLATAGNKLNTVVGGSISLLPGLSATFAINQAADGYDIISTSASDNTSPGFYLVPTAAILPYGGSSAPSGWLLCDGTSYVRATYAALFTAIGTTYGSADGTHFNVPNMCGRSPVGAGTGTTTEAVTASSGNGFTVAANNTKWTTGMPVVLSNLSGFTTTATAGPTYYITRISSTNVRLATTLALAQAGTPDITISGTGTATLTYTLTARTLGEVGGEEGHAQASGELVPHTHLAHILSAGGGALDYSTVGGGQSVQSNTGSTGGNAAMNIMQPYLTVNYIIKT